TDDCTRCPRCRVGSPGPHLRTCPPCRAARGRGSDRGGHRGPHPRPRRRRVAHPAMNVGVVGNPNYPDLGAFLATLQQKASSVGIKLYSEERIQTLWPAPASDGAPPPLSDAPPGDLDCLITFDGDEVAQYSADGIIVSTPTGSTAYSMSAGGPIVVPTVDAIVVTAICPHTLAVRPLVLPATAVVTIQPIPPWTDEVLVSFDGQV